MADSNNKKEINDLLIHLFDDELTEDQQDQLLKWSQSSPGASKEYWDFAKDISIIRLQLVNHGLNQPEESYEDGVDYEFLANLAEYEEAAQAVEIEIETEKEPLRIVPKQEKPKGKDKSFLRLSIVAAILLFAIIIDRFSSVQSESVMGKITRSVDAQWVTDNSSARQGNNLYSGSLNLSKGYVQIQLESGVILVVESPCEFSLQSLEQVFLHSGRIVARMADKRDKVFHVRTPNASIVDYGTEFGVSVTRDGPVMVDVFDGAVSLRDTSNPLRFNESLLLKKGERGEVLNRGKLSKTSFKSSKFVREQELVVRDLAKNNAYYRWQEYNYKIHRNPDLVAHYIFENDNSNILKNAAPLSGDSLNGVLGQLSSEAGANQYIPEWVPGRWPESNSALYFDEEIDARVVVPANDMLEINGPITLSAWVNISGETKGGAIIDCREGFNINYHLNLKRVAADREVVEFRRYDASKLNDQKWSIDIDVPHNKWCMVTVTHDNKIIKYYLDGNLIGEIPYEFKSSHPAQGDLIIGNSLFPWTSPFRNEIGEIYILNQAMSLEDIREMYHAGYVR